MRKLLPFQIMVHCYPLAKFSRDLIYPCFTSQDNNYLYAALAWIMYIVSSFFNINTSTLLNISYLINTKISASAMFGCCRIPRNPHVLEWIGMKFSSSFTPIHSNTRGLMLIRLHPNKTLMVVICLTGPQGDNDTRSGNQ